MRSNVAVDSQTHIATETPAAAVCARTSRLLPRVPAAKCTQTSRTPDVDNAVPVPSFTVTKMSWSEEYMGELTSQNLWSQYVRHFVGIT